ncbi:hypothetical protein A0H76_2139 [Hepatospora eriocheir]|uniref:Uncharacterized protein n=1 Tax=Hepatospora eriocheir TaxID=1081669 RepID=A0A1X0QFV3_9MICR|nr:hypothetical protein A0H76_2139 [Hepatospora eriocheir]
MTGINLLVNGLMAIKPVSVSQVSLTLLILSNLYLLLLSNFNVSFKSFLSLSILTFFLFLILEISSLNF